jgi:uncharacterized membrane protein HdeD (DUF308 family)
VSATVSRAADRARDLPAQLNVLFGIVAVIVGLFLIFRPAATVQLVVVALGVYVLARSVVAIVSALRHRRGGWGWSVAGGVMGLIVGAVVLVQPAVSAIVSVELAYFGLGIGAAILGAMELIDGFVKKPNDWPEIAIGALQLVLAVLLFVFPVAGLTIMIVFMGILTITIGVLAVASAIVGRSSAEA